MSETQKPDHEPVASRYEPRWDAFEDPEPAAPPPTPSCPWNPWRAVAAVGWVGLLVALGGAWGYAGDVVALRADLEVERVISGRLRAKVRDAQMRVAASDAERPPPSTGFWQPRAANEYVIAASSGVDSDYAWAIDEDGKVTLGRGVTADAASLQFWEAVEKNVPACVKPAEAWCPQVCLSPYVAHCDKQGKHLGCVDADPSVGKCSPGVREGDVSSAGYTCRSGRWVRP